MHIAIAPTKNNDRIEWILEKATEISIDEIKPLAIAADQMGYDSLAVSDHLIHPETFSVPYPYTDDGSVRWEAGTDWPDQICLL